MSVLHSTLGNCSPSRIQVEPKETRIYSFYPQQFPHNTFLHDNIKSGNRTATQFSNNDTLSKSKITSDEDLSKFHNKGNTESFYTIDKNPKAMLTTTTVSMGKILLEINSIEKRLKTIHETVEKHQGEPQINTIQNQIFEFEERVCRNNLMMTTFCLHVPIDAKNFTEDRTGTSAQIRRCKSASDPPSKSDLLCPIRMDFNDEF
ncbi:uncharacterized protein Gasu_23850 [Galdieria sulphuraria]|uniref:Uncharacterized protein n=1 Tax=Galdieria sulphuraria TaxID=130081 RepID=M2X1J3_GALSU|nr:uncharacterized protein Gasu_23850 [Galdieria sulphuraria]EME30230.1 hypothetical protein Gasu_23850 [Galdieria sulphuraria]|eukprot:XP_005706750.1 hypothetical protein Gasu_23850 [Galdieria sulphuraria]